MDQNELALSNKLISNLYFDCVFRVQEELVTAEAPLLFGREKDVVWFAEACDHSMIDALFVYSGTELDHAVVAGVKSML